MLKITKIKIPAAMSVLLLATLVHAEEDIEIRVQRLEQIQQNRQQFDTANQIIELQESTQSLRGEMEVQSQSIKQLENRLQLLYQDLDTRLQKLEKGGATPSATSSISPVVQSTANTVTSVAPAASNAPIQGTNDSISAPQNATLSPTDGLQEQGTYQQAYQALLDKNYPKALTGLNDYLNNYPQGRYRANAYYWLGEVHLMENQPKQAEQAFNAVLQEFPDNPKAGDALLKLGYAYAAMGNIEQAKLTLNQVVQRYPNTALANLAQARLSEL